MPTYTIDVSPDHVHQEYEVLLQGPGLSPDGRRYIFANTYRCHAFVEAVNFAYRQGLRDGASGAQDDGFTATDRLFVVTGTTPENIQIRPESWFARLKRHMRPVG